MRIDADRVRHLARLARLHVPESEIPRLVEGLSGILEHLDRLGALPAASVQPGAGEPTASRPDDPEARLDPGALHRLSPAWSPPYYVAPAPRTGHPEVPG
jgi:aspartyl/glutamyl-tRNA(Asn/Gln) amidotransferase C subunit